MPVVLRYFGTYENLTLRYTILSIIKQIIST